MGDKRNPDPGEQADDQRDSLEGRELRRREPERSAG
jgi:hypothetical protein